MVLSQASIGFEKLSDLLGLPPDTKVVGIKENEAGNVAVIKIASPRMPANVHLKSDDPLSKLGEAYQMKSETRNLRTLPLNTEVQE